MRNVLTAIGSIALALIVGPLPLMAQTTTTSSTGGTGAATATASGGNATATASTGSAVGAGLIATTAIQSPVGSAGSATTIPSSSNYLAQTFVNPFSLGMPANYASKFGPQNTVAATKGKMTFLYVATPAASTAAALSTSNAGFGFNTYGTPRSPVYSTVLAPDIPVPQHSAIVMQTDLRTVIARSSFLRNKNLIQVDVDGNTAILSGVVGTEKERRIAEGLVRTTPGIFDVRNELQVVQK